MSLFGASTSIGANTSAFQPQQQQMQQPQMQQLQQQPQHSITTANTPYKSLPPNVQKQIDDIYKLVHQHSQTMATVSSLQPKSLRPIHQNNRMMNRMDSADIAAGFSSTSNTSATTSNTATNTTTTATNALEQKISSIHKLMNKVKQEIDTCTISTNETLLQNQEIFESTFSYGVYPTQMTAARLGLTHEQLPQLNSLVHTASDVVKKLNSVLAESAMSVDYVEGMPSVYLWRVISDFEERCKRLHGCLKRLHDKIEFKFQLLMKRCQDSTATITTNHDRDQNVLEDLNETIQIHCRDLVNVSEAFKNIHNRMVDIRPRYKERIAMERFQNRRNTGMTGGGSNGGGGAFSSMIGIGHPLEGGGGGGSSGGFDPFLEAEEREKEYERRLDLLARQKMLQAAPPPPQAPAPQQQQTNAAAGGLFGVKSPTPAAGGFGFGLTPAPAGGGLFGSTPAPAGGGFGFGSTPAPAPAGGGLFGSTPAPASGGLFGSTLAPAPAAGGGLFGANSPTPAAGGFGFGSTPASVPTPTQAAAPAFGFGGIPAAPTPAPAGGGLFGSAAAPAPVAGGFSFANTAAPSTSTTSVRSRSKSRGRRR
jgi:hypothetical protein